MARRSKRIGIITLGTFAIIVGGGALWWYYVRDADALWKIVHERCALSPHHTPCAIYSPSRGMVLLKDQRGRGQYLLIPLQRVSGIESEILLKPDTPNYLEDAWEERHFVSDAYGRFIADDRLSLAINSADTRSQNQLHIHIDCLRQDVAQALEAYAPSTKSGDISLRGMTYRTLFLPSLEPSPFYQLRQELFASEDEKERGQHGILVASLKVGGFILLEEQATHGFRFGGIERLQDHQCRITQP
ncbi:CDP-diacylglycerol diphosphatase [Saccharibacter sp. 17.LH.SD]|uniref:CDP-diacylglycerol diphosphatase n=1 Tax=Saccharibacter sp. 17.LH.SD TaxID=2689393 RepID=UPI00136BCCCB|nr:CDP-diacylglycerol diphosphatase [Saccharibacter sp. 17.LH.SD]